MFSLDQCKQKGGIVKFSRAAEEDSRVESSKMLASELGPRKSVTKTVNMVQLLLFMPPFLCL